MDYNRPADELGNVRPVADARDTEMLLAKSLANPQPCRRSATRSATIEISDVR